MKKKKLPKLKGMKFKIGQKVRAFEMRGEILEIMPDDKWKFIYAIRRESDGEITFCVESSIILEKC